MSPCLEGREIDRAWVLWGDGEMFARSRDWTRFLGYVRRACWEYPEAQLTVTRSIWKPGSGT